MERRGKKGMSTSVFFIYHFPIFMDTGIGPCVDILETHKKCIGILNLLKLPSFIMMIEIKAQCS